MSNHGPFNTTIPSVINTTTTSREVRTGVTTSVVEEFAESRADRVVSTNLAQTMRARDILVTGENFKPRTKYYVFFDGIDVNAHMTPTAADYGVEAGTVKGTALLTDTNGALSATFSIPNTDKLNFTTGNRTLKVTDSASNSADSKSQGTAIYAANGEIKVMQEEIISTRNGRIILEELSESRMTSEVTTQEIPGTPVNWVDPLAQSFLVDVVGGIFVTSVELYFGAKDVALPVTAQIRHMSNGMPTQKILPFAEKTLAPSSINVASDASSSTKFSFPSPVFLEAGNEYCVVVMTNSNVYTCWVSEMGGRDIRTNDFIDRQPYAGSLFKSQNNSTWTADQLRDLKLKINRAKFTTTTQGSVVFENGPKSITAADLLSSNPIETISGYKQFRVSHYSHGNYDQKLSNITISGIKGDRTGSIFSFSSDTIGSLSGLTANEVTGIAGTAQGDSTGSGAIASITTTTTATTAVVLTNPGQGFAVGDVVRFVKNSVNIDLTVAAVKDTLGGIPIEYIGGPEVEVAADVSNSTSVTLTASNVNIVARSTAIGKQTVSGPEGMDSGVLVAGISGTTLTLSKAQTIPAGAKLRIGTTHKAGVTAASEGTAPTSGAQIVNDIDEYLITIPDSLWLTRSSGTATSSNIQSASEGITGGGENVHATPNVYFDTIHTTLPSIELPNTSVTTTFKASSTMQPTNIPYTSSYAKDSVETIITLNDNNTLLKPKIVASGINESEEMSNTRSFTLKTILNSTADNVSPVLDVDTMGFIGIQNRVNNIDTSAEVNSGTYVSSTNARGDNNAAVYMTKKIQLENPANSIHVLLDGYKAPDESGIDPEILVYYKVLGPDDNLQFNDVGWISATIKNAVPTDASDFKEHVYEIEGLEDFTAFSIKIVLQSVNTSNVPLIENFRAIALST